MDSRAKFLIQVLERLASPLVAAISEVGVRNMMIPDPNEEGSMKSEAEQVAGLLTRTTQMSIGLSNLVDLDLPEGEADSLRLALTSLASPLMANLYRLSGRNPSEMDIERLNAAMNAVIPYADNFAAAGDASIRLQQIDQDFFPGDPHQVTLQYMHAILPVVNSIMAYSFGQSEKKLVQEVADHLVKDAQHLRAKLFPTLQGKDQARAELSLLRMVGLIYSQCHFAEMAKLMATEEQARQGLAPSTSTLWAAYGLRLQMLEILAEVMVPGRKQPAASSSGSSSGSSSDGPGKVAPMKKSEAKQATKSDLRAPTRKDKESQSKINQKAIEKELDDILMDDDLEEDDLAPSSKASPMSFFVKKKSGS